MILKDAEHVLATHLITVNGQRDSQYDHYMKLIVLKPKGSEAHTRMSGTMRKVVPDLLLTCDDPSRRRQKRSSYT